MTYDFRGGPPVRIVDRNGHYIPFGFMCDPDTGLVWRVCVHEDGSVHYPDQIVCEKWPAPLTITPEGV